MNLRRLAIATSLGIGAIATLALLWLLGSPSTSVTAGPVLSIPEAVEVSEVEESAESPLSDATPLHYVAITGTDSGDCSTPVSMCRTIQYAVDRAGEGDEILVATGTYTDVSARAASPGYPNPPSSGLITQVVYISKTLTVRGGYTTTDWNTSNPISYPTTLDAQRQGRVLYITRDISLTVEGLHITRGNADELGGVWGDDAGGGMYVTSATATISNNRVFSNTAEYGGGVYVITTTAIIRNNQVFNNTATDGGALILLFSNDSLISSNTLSDNNGMGLFLYRSNVTLEGNTVSGDKGVGVYLLSSSGTLISNTVSFNGGGGLYLYDSTVTLNDNTISSNTFGYEGGGLGATSSTITLTGNTIISNTGSRGGGLYLDDSTVMLSSNIVASNTAGIGGGLYLRGDSTISLSSNIVASNTAGIGGGLYWGFNSTGTFSDNIVTANTANSSGGGLYLNDSVIRLSGNTIISNTANNYGGGLYLYYSTVTFSGNIVMSNTANVFYGGGLFLLNSDATFSGNTLSANTSGGGGGLFLRGSDVALDANTIFANSATVGGGLQVESSNATLGNNTVISNTADYGGGLYLLSSDATLTNTIIADNKANIVGSGLYILGSSSRLLHTTIARNNGGDGSGVHITIDPDLSGSIVTLTNTILVSHTVGVYVNNDNKVTLENTLWGTNTWANLSDWSGTGTIITGVVNLWSDPAFVSPDTGDYHIGPDSAALDTGVDVGVDNDIDGDLRPMGHGPDLGADELRIALTVTKQAAPNVVQPGAPLTYTICVTNTSDVDLNAAITDTLPDHVTPTGVLTWTPTITAVGGIWTQTVVVTVEMGYAGPLTNVVQVTTLESATGVYTDTLAPDLVIAKQVTPNPVQAGERLTCTIYLTNTGNFHLQATVTDVLPTHVAPTGILTWTPTITAPGGVWSRTIVVTAGIGYAGPLTNVVRVTTEEGASGIYTSTTTLAHIPGVVMAPDQTNSADPGTVITYTHTLTNTGNAPDILDLTHHSSQGWSVAYVTPVSVGYGQMVTFVVSVTIPTDVISGTIDHIVITATSRADTDDKASVTDTTTVRQVPGVALTPDRTGAANPGNAIPFVHTLTNNGNGPDTFDLEHWSNQGWSVTYDPSLSVGYHQTASVQVSITAPVDAISGTVENIVISATSRADPSVYDTVTDTITVNQVPNLTLAPDRTGITHPDSVITYTHILTNTGNGPDTFDLTCRSSQGWTVQSNKPIGVNYGQTATVIISVTVPSGVISGTVDTTVITATSRSSEEVFDAVTDITTVSLAPGVALIPDRTRLVNPDNVVTHTFSLINTGNGPDIFNLMHKSSQDWTVEYVTPVSVGYNQTGTVIVSVTVPPGSGGLTDVTVITATSQADAGVYATVNAATTVNTAPIADAGPDLFVVESDAVLLDGSNSTDLDGHLPLSYHWQRTGGPFVILVDADKAQAAFQAPPYQSVLTFTLTVTDALGLGSSPDTVAVYVGILPPHAIYLPLVLRNH